MNWSIIPIVQVPASNTYAWDPTIWYVCAYSLYTGAGTTFFYPENGVTNFTVTSGTTGYCAIPNFTTVPVDLPWDIGVGPPGNAIPGIVLVAYDGSFSSYPCNSVGNCNQGFTWWKVAATTISPAVVPCIDQEVKTTTLSSTGLPFQTKTSKTITNVNYLATPLTIVFSTPNTIQITFYCFNDGNGGNTTTDILVSGNGITLWSGSVLKRSIFINTVTPASGTAGTVVTITGTFDTTFSYTCVFGNSGLSPANFSGQSLKCNAPASSTTDGSGSFAVMMGNTTIMHTNGQPTFSYGGGSTSGIFSGVFSSSLAFTTQCFLFPAIVAIIVNLVASLEQW